VASSVALQEAAGRGRVPNLVDDNVNLTREEGSSRAYISRQMCRFGKMATF